ncbi:MAG TPA: YerC/YecD family TrpR-related protein [Sphingobacteriaceae bacterium]|nr:YerC/YecD family TrpR-related protein [Sphingobacteriaceae bacterium]
MAYERLRSPAVDRLFDAILGLRDREECYRFFYDLCTIGEIRTMAHRLRAAEMLAAGATYEEIQGATGMSSATVSRIRRFLEYGADGYVMVLERLAERDKQAQGAGDPADSDASGDLDGAGSPGDSS